MKKLLIFLFVPLLCFNTTNKTETDWLFIYYMPYDNNLSYWGQKIIDMLAKGTSKDVGVVLQADFEDTTGIKRYTIINGKIDSVLLSTEETNKKVYEDYLKWVSSNFSFNKYAFVFLNHGGKLSEIGLDEYPKRTYFDSQDLAEAIEAFNKQVNSKAKLLFLQQCARGNIETIFEFKDCADYCLSSQTILGAPNDYYEKTLKVVQQNKDISTLALVDSLVGNESPLMFNSYTLVDNKKVGKFVKSFQKLVKSIDTIRLDKLKLIRYDYLEEDYWDLISFLECMKSKHSKKTKLIDKNIKLLKDMMKHYKNPSRRFVQYYNGLSVYSPFNEQLNEHKHLKFFEKVDYDRLKKVVVLE